jgi:hypothetical protein
LGLGERWEVTTPQGRVAHNLELGTVSAPSTAGLGRRHLGHC